MYRKLLRFSVKKLIKNLSFFGLSTLFEFCRICFSPAVIESASVRGCLLSVCNKCSLGHVFKWSSQPKHQGNVELAAAILYSGNTYYRISEMFSLINISHFSHTVFYRLQKSILFPCLNTIYKLYRSRLLNQCYNLTDDNHFGGDGRCDSPGYSVKYGTYSLLSCGSCINCEEL